MAIQVPTYDFNGAQVKVNLRTVAGLRQLFRVEFITQAGSVVSMVGQKFTGRVNTSPVTEFECVGNEEGVDIVWGRMPEGRYSYEVCCGSQVVFYGDMIVQGRMLPPLAGEGDVSVNDSLVMSVEADSEGRIAFECSEVGLMTLLERQAMFYMGESKELRDEVAQLHDDVVDTVLEAKSNIAQKLVQANEAQINAQQSATLASEFAEQVETTHGLVEDLATQAKSDAEVASRAKVSAENTLASVGGYAQRAEQAKTKAEQAKASAEQEAYNAYSHGSAARTSAEVALSKAEEAKTSATNAQESENKAKNAQTETETLADELEEKFERAVFADNSGNVDIKGGLTVDGMTSLNGGAVLPTIPSSMDNALNLASGIGFVCLHQLFESKAVFSDILTRAGSASVISNKNINVDMGLSLKSYPNYIGRVLFTPLSGTIGIYGDSKGVIIPLIQYLVGGDKSGWIKLSFQNFVNYNTANYGTDFSLENEDSFVVFPYITTSLIFDITYKNSTNSTFFRTRYIKANTEFSSGLEMVEQNAVIPIDTNAWGRQIRAYFILSDTKSKKTFIYVLALATLYKIAEMPYIAFYEQSHYRDIHVSWGGLGEGVYGKVAFTDQTALNCLLGGIAGEFGSPWLDIANAVSVDAVTEVKEAVEFVPPAQTTE